MNTKLQLGRTKEISINEASDFVKNTQYSDIFASLNEDHNTPEIGFETVINRKYFVTKVAHGGTTEMKGSEYEYKTAIGVFIVEMTWDYRHPSNFCQNKNNLSQKFRIAF